MQDIIDFLNARKQQYIERAERLEEQEKAVKKRLQITKKHMGK